MMKYLIKYILIISLLTNSIAHAGDVKEKGHVLQETSYVFSIDEAKELKLYIEELRKDKEILEDYKELDALSQEELKLKDEQIGILGQHIKENEKYIGKLERRDKLKPLSLAGYFILGLGVGIGGMFIGKELNEKGQDINPASTARITFKF